MATLSIMTEVTFEDWENKTLTIGGYTTKWAKISFNHLTKKKKMKGYIGEDLLLKKSSTTDPTISFVYGVSKLKKINTIIM